MSFLDKIADNKSKVIAVGGVALIAVLGMLYKNYKDQNPTQIAEVEQSNQYAEFDMDKQINKIKQIIDIDNPSLNDVKKILSFSLQASKIQIFKYSKVFKKDRKKYTKSTRNENLEEYLLMVAQGMNKIQEIGMTLQQQIMTKFGIQESVFQRYSAQLGPFLQQQMMQQGAGSGKEISLTEVKKAITLQVNYIRDHGDQIVSNLGLACASWHPQQKASVPALFSVYIADEVFENYPQIDEDDLQGAEMKFQNQLQNQMYQLQTVMSPMMGKLNQKLGLEGRMGGMGGMGQMGGMDQMGGMGGGMDPMGGMGGITMEQLQQLQMQDPAAFEQMMQMMGGGGNMQFR